MQQHVSSQTPASLYGFSGFSVCVVVAIAVILCRLVELIGPLHGGPPQMASLDATFSPHPC